MGTDNASVSTLIDEIYPDIGLLCQTSLRPKDVRLFDHTHMNGVPDRRLHDCCRIIAITGNPRVTGVLPGTTTKTL